MLLLAKFTVRIVSRKQRRKSGKSYRSARKGPIKLKPERLVTTEKTKQ